jgi:hypothetical protein
VNNVFASLSKLALLLRVCTVEIPSTDAHSREKGKSKAKGSQHVATKEKHGRDAGNLPFGIQRHTEQKADFHRDCKKRNVKMGL